MALTKPHGTTQIAFYGPDSAVSRLVQPTPQGSALLRVLLGMAQQ